MTTSKKKASNNSDIEFCDVLCLRCNKKVSEQETKEMMNRNELDEIE